MVLAWLAAMVVMIGPNSRSRGSSTPTTTPPGRSPRPRATSPSGSFDGYSGQEIYVVWKDAGGADSPAVRQGVEGRSSPKPNGRQRRPATPIRISEDGKIGSTTLPLTVPGWEVEKEDGEKLIAAAEANSGDGLEIRLGGDPIYHAQEESSPEGIGFLGAAIVLLIAFGSVVAAGLPLAIALIGLGSPPAA